MSDEIIRSGLRELFAGRSREEAMKAVVEHLVGRDGASKIDVRVGHGHALLTWEARTAKLSMAEGLRAASGAAKVRIEADTIHALEQAYAQILDEIRSRAQQGVLKVMWNAYGALGQQIGPRGLAYVTERLRRETDLAVFSGRSNEITISWEEKGVAARGRSGRLNNRRRRLDLPRPRSREGR